MKVLFSFLSAIILTLVSLSPAVAQSDYQVRVGDTLTVEVLEDSSLNRSVVVLPSGQISFPFAGTLQVAGRTIGQIEQTIRAAIGENFVSTPSVFVTVRPQEELAAGELGGLANPIDVYFLGAVVNPGRISVESGTTLLQALAISGGPSRFAAIKRIQLRRTDPVTKAQTIQNLNYKALSQGATLTRDIELRDGDVILFPERRLFE